MAAALARNGIKTGGQLLAQIVMHAELDGVICSGPLREKRFTYALLDERVPLAKPRSREEALAELTRRFVTSHGPATPRDFASWSGLTMATRDGRFVGGWRRALTKKRATVPVSLRVKLDPRERRALEESVAAYGTFAVMGADVG